jgi:hypothetical protein
VSDSVAFGLPAGIVGLGIIGAIVFVVVSYYRKPSINIVDIGELEANDKNIPLKRI